MEIQVAQRVKNLPESYVFGKIAKAKAAAREAGRRVYDFGIGDPDWGAPIEMVEDIITALRDPTTHDYPDTEGLRVYREAWAGLYRQVWGVLLDPETEVHALIGGKEGIGHVPLAFVNPGDIVICPDPAYPVYDEGTIIAGGEPYYLPLLEENGFLPDFESVPQDIAARAKIFWINSPNNPTGSKANLKYFTRLAKWGKQTETMVFSDATYSHIGSERPSPSFLQAPGSMEVGVEFHSISKTFSFTGARCAAVVGNSDIIKGLHRIKASLDSGVPDFIQEAVATHLLSCEEYTDRINNEYSRLRVALQQELANLGFAPYKSEATFYVWAKNPTGFEDSEAFAYDLIEKTGVVCVPGKGLGRQNGEGYTRWSVARATMGDIRNATVLVGNYLTTKKA
ncbi:MAG: aminotransferase class I/II-fold pyridoxal phosphate-dependent enzyme [Candidatus Woykebacteria bacterium]